MKRLGTVALIGIVAVSLVPTARAETTWDLSGYGGYCRSLHDDDLNGSFGMRLGAFAMIKPTFGIGVEAAHNRLGSLDIDSLTIEGPPLEQTRGEVTVSGWGFTGSAKLQGRGGDWRPFVIGGLGLYPMTYAIKLQNGGRSDVNRTKFGYNLGVGLAWVPGGDSPIAIGFDARWNGVPGGRVTREELEEVIETGQEAEGSTLNYGTIFFGVTYNTSGMP
jgi:hypothetical protein